jgi:E3 ubiquitin-protein ligase MYCBP2
VTFKFLSCPLCRQDMHHPMLEETLKPFYGLRRDIEERGVLHFAKDGLKDEETIMKQVKEQYSGSVEAWSLDHFDFFKCFKCQKPYFAGRHECGGEVEDDEEGKDNADPEGKDLVCAACSVVNVPECKKHGKDYIQFKCRFCCALSTWLCWDKTHFCSNCHGAHWGKLVTYPTGVNKLKMPGEGHKRNTNTKYEGSHFTDGGADHESEYISCPGIASGDPSQCPLKILHSPNGEEFGMGCALCADGEDNDSDE